VQIALNALNCPLDGWVTTTFAAVKTFPPPDGISLVAPSTVPPPLDAEGCDPAAAALLEGALLLAELLLLPPPPLLHAARTVTPARPAPASKVRRVASCSCVTVGYLPC